MATFSNTNMPPTVRLGGTADPVLTVMRNTSTVAVHVELVRPAIVRMPQATGVVVQFKRPVVRRRRAKRLRLK